MAELAINNIIKIILAVFVFVLVVVSVALAFKNYLMPYFAGISPSEDQVDLNDPYYKSLVQPKNVVATVQEKNGRASLVIQNQVTNYYFDKRDPKKIRLYVPWQGNIFDWKLDPQIGSLGSDRKIRISDLTKHPDLASVNLAERIGNELYKPQP